MGFDLLTGVFVLIPLALMDKRKGVTLNSLIKNWSLVFLGNLLGSLTIAIIISFIFTYGYQADPGIVGNKIALIGEARTIGYSEYGIDYLIEGNKCGVLCNDFTTEENAEYVHLWHYDLNEQRAQGIPVLGTALFALGNDDWTAAGYEYKDIASYYADNYLPEHIHSA
jgi:hypothetical protein